MVPLIPKPGDPARPPLLAHRGKSTASARSRVGALTGHGSRVTDNIRSHSIHPVSPWHDEPFILLAPQKD